jgi:saccharopine dehydrogenase-like NADP-dependent oxidoreductase
MRIVVLGGTGNFGSRICRALAGDSEMEVIAAARHPDRTQKPFQDPRVRQVALDLASEDFSAALRRLAPGIVIHCAGPFQDQDYRVARAAIAAGAHYLDLSDGREFVARFAEHNDAAAREAKVCAISGASTLPALSSAVIDSMARRLYKVDEIQVAIAPGQRAPRGAATVAAVLGYAGRPFRWLSGGVWTDVWGWQELRRVRFEGLGVRWGAACDVPDLELFPEWYLGVKTVEFRAALELTLEQIALWIVAALRRGGMSVPIERWGRALDFMAMLLGAFGSERGGMLVSFLGSRAGGSRVRVEWHLTADANHGPEIPCMGAILLARKLARGETLPRGAFPCLGFLKLEEFESEFAKWKISTVLKERNA